jgi:hypothetical protein
MGIESSMWLGASARAEVICVKLLVSLSLLTSHDLTGTHVPHVADLGGIEVTKVKKAKAGVVKVRRDAVSVLVIECSSVVIAGIVSPQSVSIHLFAHRVQQYSRLHELDTTTPMTSPREAEDSLSKCLDIWKDRAAEYPQALTRLDPFSSLNH